MPLRVSKRCLRNFGRPLDCCTWDNEGSDESAILGEREKKLQRKTESEVEVSVKRTVLNEGERRRHEHEKLTNQSSLTRRDTSANTRLTRI